MSDMLRLSAPVDHPYRIAIAAAADDSSLEVTVTAPDSTTTTPTLTLNGQRWVAPLVPAQLGLYTITVTASDDAGIVGSAFELLVSTTGPADLVVDDSVLDPACGIERPLRWPCPNLAALDCIDEYSADSIRTWVAMASRTFFADTGSRWPGCHWYARLRPAVGGSCLTPLVRGGYGFDLFPTVRYPVLELLEVEIDGAAADLADWSIEQHRYLVPGEGVHWPSQDWLADLGSAGTWSVLVRYGRPVDPLVLRARDLWALAMIVETEPTVGGTMACRLPDGTTQISENGRTMTLDAAAAGAALWERLTKRYGPSSWDLSRIVDPAEPTARDSRFARIVPGDQTPADHALWLGSGCDLEAELAALTP